MPWQALKKSIYKSSTCDKMHKKCAAWWIIIMQRIFIASILRLIFASMLPTFYYEHSAIDICKNVAYNKGQDNPILPHNQEVILWRIKSKRRYKRLCRNPTSKRKRQWRRRRRQKQRKPNSFVSPQRSVVGTKVFAPTTLLMLEAQDHDSTIPPACTFLTVLLQCG